MKMAAIQMCSQANVEQNLSTAKKWIDIAAKKGANYIVLPEYFYYISNNNNERVLLAEDFLNGPIQHFASTMALKYNIWLVAGTVPIKSNEPSKFYNSQLLYSPDGECVDRYDKVHLFAFDNGSESYHESDTMVAGEEIKTFYVEDLSVRPSTCYDLRFSEFYRLTNGYDLINVPAAFTYTTGVAHWEILLRSRAIENQCYLIASAQVGDNSSTLRTFGHSMIIDPWGKVIDCLPEGEGVVYGDLDSSILAEIRTQLPALKNRIFT